MRHRFSRLCASCVVCLTAAAALIVSSMAPLAQRAPKFFPDDPISREPETQDASKVQSWDIGLAADLIMNLYAHPGDRTPDVRAQNINTIDEVPDSSWFTNRIYTQPLSNEELTRGPNTISGPAGGRWTIIRPKSAGAAPGFTARDEKGEVWFVSFDPRGTPQAASAAIMVASRLFWALGYYQVESYLATIRPEDLVIAETAMIRGHGKRRRMTHADLRDVLNRSARNADGSYRVLAGRAVPGRPIGGFKYHGTRPDDPNDVIPHEHRRELRALQVFAAWTNLVDVKAGNTLDTVITENGRGVVRHYLQDVGSTFGTGALGPRDPLEGYEHIVEGGPALKRLMTFGFYIRPWQTIDYVGWPEVGLFEGDRFEPEVWRTRVPAAALQRARADDAFWAALRVMAFTDDQIRAAVKVGGFTDPAAEAGLGDVLIKRRDRIGRAYLSKINPLVHFALDTTGALTFENPAVKAGFEQAPRGGYRAAWSRFDNSTGETQSIGEAVTSTNERLQAPSSLPASDRAVVKVQVSAVDPPHAPWSQPVDLYFRRTDGGWKLIGVERMPDSSTPVSKTGTD